MSELLSYILNHEEAFRRARLPSLYSDFSPQRHTNPDGYASNIAAWQTALARAALAGRISSSGSTGTAHTGKPGIHANNLLVLRTGNALLAELETRELGRPVALQCVIDEALRNGQMIPVNSFLESETNPFKKGWYPPSLTQVLMWGLKQARGLMLSGESDHSAGFGRLQTNELLLVDNLKKVAKQIIKIASTRHRSVIDRIYSREMFIAQYSDPFGEGVELTDLDFEILLKHLSRDENTILYDDKTVKFKDPNENSNFLTQEDKTIASLKTLISNLSSHIAVLDHTINALTAKAQAALSNNNRILALSALRSKKLAERNLKQRADTLSQLEEVFANIEQAANQVEIVQAMKDSTTVLRQFHAQVGGVERVEDVVEELRKEMENVDEVGAILNEAGPVIDEGELDEELQELERHEREVREENNAEMIRQKLAELDKARLKIGEPGAGTENPAWVASGATTIDELDESIDKLSQMSIDDRSPSAKPKEKERPLHAD
ncbi:hypothetical protein FQN57_003749 [Myotisia sp. PD_48]|nr:hypothetical protein FQN57_003749 [Myotisia sp. PD_48]